MGLSDHFPRLSGTPADRQPDRERALAEVITHWLPVLIDEQLDCAPPTQRRHCLSDDYTLGYLAGALGGLCAALRLSASDAQRFGTEASVFGHFYGARAPAMLVRTQRALASGNPRLSAGHESGRADAQRWITLGQPAMALAREFSLRLHEL